MNIRSLRNKFAFSSQPLSHRVIDGQVKANLILLKLPCPVYGLRQMSQPDGFYLSKTLKETLDLLHSFPIDRRRFIGTTLTAGDYTYMHE